MRSAAPLVACPHCATLHRRVVLSQAGSARCRCCASTLYKRGRLPLASWCALAWTTLILFGIAQGFPLAHLSLQGREVHLTFYGALALAWNNGLYGVAAMTALAGFLLPLAQIVFTLWAMHAILARWPVGRFRTALRGLAAVTPWAMAAVLVLGILVSVVKIAGMVRFEIGPGLPAFLVLIFLLAGLAGWDSRALWMAAEDRGLVRPSGASGTALACRHCGCVQGRGAAPRCARCHARLSDRARRTVETAPVWAFMLAAIAFYVPANVLPIMRVRTVLDDSAHTILGGVQELWAMGAWDLALIVFVASVLVPLTKLLVLGFLLLRAHPQDVHRQRQRTRWFVAVERIGQWSMLDVFVVVLMAAMANFPGLSQIMIGPAAISFGAVVVLTMLATRCYDPRWGWDWLRGQPLDGEGHGAR